MKEANNITIRPETAADHHTVENLIRESFWNVYRPGCMEHYLMHVLRQSAVMEPALNLVLCERDTIIGQCICVHSAIRCDDGREIPTLTLGPVCIAPEKQKQGYGKLLLDYTLDAAAKLGERAVLLEGNILFYGKSGFVTSKNYGIRYGDMLAEEDTSFFLCRELYPGALANCVGEYHVPTVYDIEPDAVEAYDRQFLPKEKKKLPGQLFD